MGSRKEGHEVDSRGNTSLRDDADWDCSVIPHLELNKHEDSKENTCNDEQEWNSPIRPSVCCSSPLQSQKQRDNPGKEENCADGIQLHKLFSESKFVLFGWRLKNEKDDADNNPSDRKIDVETPPPADVSSKRSAKQGSADRSNSKHGSKNALIHGPLMKRDGYDHYVHTTAEDARSSKTSYY
jgi:hypothetical protein